MPNGAESGWGVSLTHQGDIIFVAWFTYDFDGSALWLVAAAQRVDAGLYEDPRTNIRPQPTNATSTE